MERLTWRPPFAPLGPPAFLDQFAVDSPPGSFVCSQPRQHMDGANTAEVVLLVSNEAMVPEGRRRDWTACIERQRATQHRVEARRAAGCVDSGHGTSRFAAPQLPSRSQTLEARRKKSSRPFVPRGTPWPWKLGGGWGELTALSMSAGGTPGRPDSEETNSVDELLTRQQPLGRGARGVALMGQVNCLARP